MRISGKRPSAAHRGVTRLILFVHGSRDPRWREPFERLAAGLMAELGEGAVRVAYLEASPPTLLETAEEAARDGVTRLRLLPLFMAGGLHVDRDIPAQAAAVRRAFPGLTVELLPPIGDDARFIRLLNDLAKEAARG